VGTKIFLGEASPPPDYGCVDFCTSQKTNVFLRILCAFSILVQFSKIRSSKPEKHNGTTLLSTFFLHQHNFSAKISCNEIQTETARIHLVPWPARNSNCSSDPRLSGWKKKRWRNFLSRSF